MIEFSVKSFSLSKDDNPDSNQDSMSVDINKKRFVVADGVSNSYRPDITSKLLCEYFIKSDYHDDAWVTIFYDSILHHVSEDWNTEVERIESSLTGRAKTHAEYYREDFCMGASTFAGLHLDIEQSILNYNVLGDSSIFIIPNDGPYKILSTCEETLSNGRLVTNYGRVTECVGSHISGCKGHPQLEVLGEWRSGREMIRPGYIVLATDAVSAWLQDSLLSDQRAADLLWGLKDQDDFTAFAELQRKSSYMDDDLTIIIIRIIQTPYNVDSPVTILDTEANGTNYLVPIELYDNAERIIYGHLHKDVYADEMDGRLDCESSSTRLYKKLLYFTRIWLGRMHNK